MRDCWDVLGLEYGVDKKAIKSAYAKRLKKTRPDEDPEGFKALHDAYKTAIQIASSDYYQQETLKEEEASAPLWDEDSLSFDDEPASVDSREGQLKTLSESDISSLAIEDSSEDKGTHHALKNDESLAAIEAANQEGSKRTKVSSDDLEFDYAEDEASAQSKAEEEAMYETLQADWDALFDRVQEMIASPKGGLAVKEWQYIEDVPSMLDLEFKGRASDQMFGIVAETNEISLRAKSLRIQPPILNYLNDFFGWDDKWQDYEFRFSPELLDAVYPYLSSAQNADAEHNSGTREVHYYKRMMAFLMDVAIVFTVVKLAVLMLTPFGVTKGSGGDWFIGGFFVYFLLIVPVFEMSRTEASLGKMVFGLRVINKQGLKLPWYQSFWRSFISIVCLAGFKIVVWLNIFFIHKYDALLQDLLSKSYIAKSNNNLFTYIAAVKRWFGWRK